MSSPSLNEQQPAINSQQPGTPEVVSGSGSETKTTSTLNRGTDDVPVQKMEMVLIGLGMVANTHVQAIADLSPTLHLKGVLSRDQNRCSRFAEEASQRCGYKVTAFSSLAEVLASEVSFVILATPPNARKDYVMQLSAAGVHLLVEKPVERTHEAAQELVDVCEQRGVKLGVVLQHRARAASLALADHLQSGVLGKLGLVEVSVPWWREQRYYDEPGRGSYQRDGGGVLISQAIHTLDLMLSLTGKVDSVQALCSTTAFHDMESEDFVTAGFVFANGAVGSMSATTAAYPGAAESIKLHFSNAVAVLAQGCLELLWRDGKTERIGEEAQTGGGADPMAFTSDWHRDIIANFAGSLVSDQPMTVSGREALEVHRLIEALVESSRCGRRVSIQ